MSKEIAKEIEKLADDFGIDRKRSIGEIADELGVETHVIRFWEEQFPQIKPETGKGGRRYYYNKQIKVLKRIKKFLHEDGYTIAGLQKLLKKRKQESGQEEDLDIIISEEKLLKIGQNNAKLDQNDAKMADFSLSDFIDSKVEIAKNTHETHKKLDSNAKGEVTSLLRSIQGNLGELKQLLKS